MRSFLNIINIKTGRQIRIAELPDGYSYPSFYDNHIIFYKGNEAFSLSLDSGKIERRQVEIEASPTAVRLNFTSELTDGIGYCELIYGEKVLSRFMGSYGSIGSAPIKNEEVVYFGYSNENSFGEK